MVEDAPIEKKRDRAESLSSSLCSTACLDRDDEERLRSLREDFRGYSAYYGKLEENKAAGLTGTAMPLAGVYEQRYACLECRKQKWAK